jgi:putative ATPase
MTIYLATAPKSNTAKVALGEALEAARNSPAAPVPLHIRNAPTPLMKQLGYGAGYRYAHDSPTGYTPQEYLPDELKEATFYVPGNTGYEKKVAERLAWWAQQKKEEDR